MKRGQTMRARTSLIHALGAAVLTVACGGNEAPKPETARSLKAADARAPASDPGSPAPAPAVLPAQPSAALALHVVRSSAGVGLRVINAGKRTLSLAAQVTFEELRGANAAAVPGQTLTLQLNCKSSGCVTLAAGAEIDAPAWLEQVGGERCGALLVPPAAGRYRLRVQTCDGALNREVELAWPVE